MFFFSWGSRLPLQVEMSEAMLENIFKRFKRVRVLVLRGTRIKRVPSSIGKLSELVYLDLSENDVKKLPSCITKLSNLETLKLSACYSLQELPKNFEKLTKLQHLDIEGCVGLTGMPRNMSNLSSLQSLSTFVANKNVPHGDLQNLARLTQLRSQHFEILHLERVIMQFHQGSEVINVLSKESGPRRLTLRWDLGVDQNEDLHHLFSLPSYLLELILVGYKGCFTPTNWFPSLQFLVKLSLYDCHGCTCLFVPGYPLPKLRILQLVRLDNLEFIASDCVISAPFYSNLKELILSDCPKLNNWWSIREIAENEIPFFSSISKLHVHNCPLLTCIPRYPDIDQELVLVGSSLKLLLDSTASHAQGFSKLRSMQVSSVTDIQDFNHLHNLSACFKHMSSLQRLTIENCAEINLDGRSNQWEGLKSLCFLTVKTTPILSTLSFGDSITTLQELTLHNCHGLTSISDSIHKVTSLQRLSISRCNKLESLPKAMKNLKSLQTLIILDCALLLPRCQPQTGDDWPQISHIKYVQVK